MDNELRLRQEAIKRVLTGEAQTQVAQALGKSRQWVGYWMARYDPDAPIDSLRNHPSTPHKTHRQWSEEVIQMALNSRQMRMAGDQPGYAYALVGAEAIHYELQALGVKPTPPVRTIHYWLTQAGLVLPAKAEEAADKPTKPYPAPVCQAVNDVHQLDLKGPLYLTGRAHKYYVLALRDVHSKAVALDSGKNRQAQTIADFLVAAWQRIGLPKVLQLDNGLEFRGSNRYPRSFGKVVRVCLDMGIEPLFIPPHEPWRNGVIENLNGQVVRLLLNRDQFADERAFRQGAHQLEIAINTTHRLAALDGRTPNEFRTDQPIRYLAADYTRHRADLPLNQGTIAFVRLVRKSGRITLHAQDKFDIDPALNGHYVLARVDVAGHTLQVYHDEHLIKSFDF